MKKDNIRYFSSYDRDFSETANQDYRLPEDYTWIRRDAFSKIVSSLVYLAALLISPIYCRLFLHVSFKNRKVLKSARKSGGFIYGNHTQPVGDVFDPALGVFPSRIYTVISPANLGIPFIGKLLPYLGGLPISPGIKGLRKLNEAIEYRLSQNAFIVIYPEAHVWEYCKDIRPFDKTSFSFPVKFGKPVFTMTATYKKRRFGKKPKMTVFFDGPFYADTSLTAKAQAEELFVRAEKMMKERSTLSDCEYIKYVRIPQDD